MASGQRLHYFLPQIAEYPVDPAETHAFRRVRSSTSHYVIQFAAGKNIHFKNSLARNYAGGGITVKIQWCMESITSGNIKWQCAFQRISTTLDLDSHTFGTVNSASDDSVPGTAGVTKITDIACDDGTDINDLEPGELFRLLIHRDTATGDAGGNAQLVDVELVET